MAVEGCDAVARARVVIRDGDTKPEAFFAHLHPNCRFQWGNGQPVTGLPAIQGEVAATLAGVRRLSHDVLGGWGNEHSAVLEMTVHYELENGARVSTPAVTIMRFDAARIIDYRVYQDRGPLIDAQRGP